MWPGGSFSYNSHNTILIKTYFCYQEGIVLHIVALLLSLFAGIFSLLQGGFVVLLGGLGGGLGKAVGDAAMEKGAYMVGGAGLLIVMASFTGIAGGILATMKKKAGLVFLVISAIITTLAAAGGFKDGYVYGIMYGSAAICSFISFHGKPISKNSFGINEKNEKSPESSDQHSTQKKLSTETKNDVHLQRFCTNCGKDLEGFGDALKFCPFCGTGIVSTPKADNETRQEEKESASLDGEAKSELARDVTGLQSSGESFGSDEKVASSESQKAPQPGIEQAEESKQLINIPSKIIHTDKRKNPIFENIPYIFAVMVIVITIILRFVDFPIEFSRKHDPEPMDVIQFNAGYTQVKGLRPVGLLNAVNWVRSFPLPKNSLGFSRLDEFAYNNVLNSDSKRNSLGWNVTRLNGIIQKGENYSAVLLGNDVNNTTNFFWSNVFVVSRDGEVFAVRPDSTNDRKIFYSISAFPDQLFSNRVIPGSKAFEMEVSKFLAPDKPLDDVDADIDFDLVGTGLDFPVDKSDQAIFNLVSAIGWTPTEIKAKFGLPEEVIGVKKGTSGYGFEYKRISFLFVNRGGGRLTGKIEIKDSMLAIGGVRIGDDIDRALPKLRNTYYSVSEGKDINGNLYLILCKDRALNPQDGKESCRIAINIDERKRIEQIIINPENYFLNW